MNKEDRKKELQRELEQLEQEQAEEGLQSVLEKLNEPVGEYEYTDMGNAERYVAKFGHSCKYIYEKAKWIVWDGNKWRFDEEGVAVQNIKECNREILLEYETRVKLNELIASLNLGEKEQKDLQKRVVKSASEAHQWYKRSQSAATVSATLTLAKSEKGVSKSITELDSKGHYLGVKNGVIDLRKDKFRFIEGDPAYFMTKSCNVSYDPDADCPKWEEFLDKIFLGDSEIISFIQRIVGQGLFGLKGKDKLTIFYGTGSNGKTTLLDTLQKLLGDYATSTDAKMLTSSSLSIGGKQEYYLADLMGIRTVLINESVEGARLAEEVVKMLVDSGEVKARYPAGQPFSFQPVMTPILSTNHKPNVSNDYAIWRRIWLVPFDYTFTEEEKDPRFIDNWLVPELAGILNWALKGCIMFQKEGLNPPEKVKAATEQYKEEQDEIGAFIEERLIASPKSETKMSEVYRIWKWWCDDNNINLKKYGGSRKFKALLQQRGMTIEKTAGGVDSSNQDYLFDYVVQTGDTIIDATSRFKK